MLSKGDQPAFPCLVFDQNSQPSSIAFSGMSLRDWFAGQALVCLQQLWMDLPAKAEAKHVAVQLMRLLMP